MLQSLGGILSIQVYKFNAFCTISSHYQLGYTANVGNSTSRIANVSDVKGLVYVSFEQPYTSALKLIPDNYMA